MGVTTDEENLTGGVAANAEAPFDRAGVLTGARRALPVSVSILSYALVFGLLARQAGVGGVEAALMSALVYSGTVQFIALDLWRSPPPIGPLVLTALIVSLRLVLMGATLRPLLPERRPLATYGSAFFLADENWALTMAEVAQGRRNGAFLLGAGLPMFVAWTGGTALGWAAGAVVADPARLGLDFAITAVFLALLPAFWRGRTDLVPWLTAAAVAVAAQYAVDGPWYILLGGLSGSLIGVLRHGR
jgi:4-azaleucine resistance transporter AzlC